MKPADKVQVDLKPQSVIFVRVEGSARHVCGTVSAVRAQSPNGRSAYWVDFDEIDFAHEVEKLDIYFESGDKFWHQQCVFGSTRRTATGHVAVLELMGSPRPADHRGKSRADATLAGITVRMADGYECLAINVSEQGLAIVSGRPLELEDVLPIDLRWQSDVWVGTVEVRNARRSVRDTWIYGLATSPDKNGDALRTGLTRIAATLRFRQSVLAEADESTSVGNRPARGTAAATLLHPKSR